MTYRIRKATLSDMKAVLNLIHELAAFENEPHEVEITLEDLQRDGFGTDPKFTCFVAESDTTILGAAIVYMRYSTWKGSVLHLEDLIVSQSARGKGLGTALLNSVVKYGNAIGVKRIGWEVLDWNTPAINFYEQKGANVMRNWHLVQMNQESINNYLSNLDHASI